MEIHPDSKLKDNLDVRKKIGNRIKARRMAKGLSQEKLAQLLKVSWASLCRWENAQRTPTPGNLARLEEILGPVHKPEELAEERYGKGDPELDDDEIQKEAQE